ncbi:MAG: eL32 family ribosomal protein [Candidatus Woesearchaeota archaeon]
MTKKEQHLLEHRKRLKARKPLFIKQDAHKRAEVKKKWARPRGVDSKMRLNIRGYRRCVSVGWKSPAEVRGLDRSGLTRNIICNLSDLKNLNPERDGAILSAKLGIKKRLELVKEAMARKITILNIKNPEEFIKRTLEDRNKIKAEREEKQKAKTEKKATIKPKEKREQVSNNEKDSQKTESEVTEFDKKKEEERREQEKILTKRE